MAGLPLLRGFPAGGVFARRGGQPIPVATFLSDVAALAARLPAQAEVVNLCTDRYRFAVGFAAALCRGQVSLLPTHETGQALAALAASHPGLYCLTDAAPPAGLPVFAYPADLHGDAAAMPEIPEDRIAVVLFTSGSTGPPQPHPRSWGALVRSTWAAGERLGIAALQGGTLVGTVPLQHSFGLESMLMLAFQHGLVLEAARPFFSADIRALLAEAPRPRLLVTTPVHLRTLIAEPGPAPAVDFILSATAPLAPQLARAAEAAFAGPLHEIYGCSEAGQIAARRTSEGAEWRCLDGIVLDRDAAGVWASGPQIPARTLLGDVIEEQDATRFLLHGRLADTVNIAGKRTSLAHLNHQLNAIAGVEDGVFVVPPDAGDGRVARLIAFAVAPGLEAEAILAVLRRTVDPAFLPRPLYRLASLPRNSLGKLPAAEIESLIALAREG
jgi:acyl-coenzyme A synthetase/AMP-(fatty) acid ligase